MNISDINLFKRLKKSPIQKEIDELNSNLSELLKHSTDGTKFVNLTANEEYICPCDGYIRVKNGNSAGNTVAKFNNYDVCRISYIAGDIDVMQCFFVRKDMHIIYTTTNEGKCTFIPFV